MKLGAVILGAGFSRRFGGDKRIASLHGKTVAECTVEKYLSAFDEVRLVLRPTDDVLKQKLSTYNLDIVESEHAHLGMGHSLASGFEHLKWEWAFVALLDMPFVASNTLDKLKGKVASLTEPHIVRPVLHTQGKVQPGHPVGWHNAYFSQLAQCSGDTGARTLLCNNKDDVLNIEVNDPGILKDIDRPTDLPN